MRVIFCRHEKCGHSQEIVAGQFPAVCPKCKNESRWSMTPGSMVKAKHAKEARPGAARITKQDGEFLKSIHVAPWDPPADVDDDCA